MTSTDKYTCLASRGVLNLYKGKLQSAVRAHSLLRKKSDALQIKFRRILARIAEVQALSGDVVSDAGLCFAKADYVAGTFWHHLVLNAVDFPSLTVTAKQDNVAGVQLPFFECEFKDHDDFELLQIGKGGQQVRELKTIYREVVKYLIGIASLQLAFTALDTVIRITNKRLNTLEFIAIPKLQRTIEYIISELDEYEREDFYRMKVTKAKKPSVVEKTYHKEESSSGSSGTSSSTSTSTSSTDDDEDIGDYHRKKRTPNILDKYKKDPDILF